MWFPHPEAAQFSWPFKCQMAGVWGKASPQRPYLWNHILYPDSTGGWSRGTLLLGALP